VSKYIEFVYEGPSKSGKTKVWNVDTTGEKDGGPVWIAHTIGTIKWFAPWRKYCFFPEGATTFEWTCLRDIADFCQKRTLQHRGQL
jgi:hypothetical protein